MDDLATLKRRDHADHEWVLQGCEDTLLGENVLDLSNENETGMRFQSKIPSNCPGYCAGLYYVEYPCVSHLLEPDDLGLLQHLDGPGRPSFLSCRIGMSQYRRGILDTMPLYIVGVTVDKAHGAYSGVPRGSPCACKCERGRKSQCLESLQAQRRSV